MIPSRNMKEEAGRHIASISGIVRTVETVSLELLRKVDGTVETMEGLAKIADGVSILTAAAITSISSAEVVSGEYLDPDDKAIDTMERTSCELKDYLQQLVLKRATIDTDPLLCDHHCEALHDAYESAMNAVAELAELLQQFRAAIISHDLKAEPRDDCESFQTVQDLIADLRGE